MIYRMKQNAVGLASICILSTMVLVTVSTTASLMIGVEDIINTSYPYDIGIYADSADREKNRRAIQAVKDVLEFHDISIQDETQYYSLEFSVFRQDDRFYPISDEGSSTALNILMFMTLEDYNRMAGTDYQLESGEVLLYTDNGDYRHDSVEILGRSFRIAHRPQAAAGKGQSAAYGYPVQHIVLKDLAEMERISGIQNAAYTKAASRLQLNFGVNLNEDAKTQLEVYDSVTSSLKSQDFEGRRESKLRQSPEVRALYAGFFFLGIFLGTLFLAATILIIYYKQVSEGYEDRTRFDIMQKVGMSHHEVKRSIHTQVLTVFFMPLAVAGLHTAVAFPIVRKLLLAFSLTNTRLYVLCTAASFLLFGALYCLVYLRTARTYYKIVSR